MSLVRLSMDNDALPAALLPDFKAWARIDHDDDDRSLTLTLARALDNLQTQLGVEFLPSVWQWMPRATGDGSGLLTDNRLDCECRGRTPSWSQVPVPVRGVSSFTASRGGVDVSGEYALEGNTFYSDFALLFLTHATGVVANDVIELQTGPVDDTGVNIALYRPTILDMVFRYAAYLWEYRESGTDRELTDAPDFITRVWSTLWAPRI